MKHKSELDICEIHKNWGLFNFILLAYVDLIEGEKETSLTFCYYINITEKIIQILKNF